MGERMRRQRRQPGGSPERINIRTTTTIYAALYARARVAGLSLPRYLVESGLHEASGSWSLRQQRWWAERLDVVEVRMIRIGTNLNQIAARLHATGALDAGTAAALDYLTTTLHWHREILDAIDPAADRHRPRP